ncbi:hypothetical protein Cch01nite_37150 [Cellulomonas chitinilytica]|uniref:Uncharacterized protein n=1 Tax=Cellulomonas chitinilytica TaxID=398759 RepID=A0A919P3X5_9CELL|nr:hypothetical protein Cch01nite_37150 [Cellulomonas chitinilytica]
MFHRMAVRRCPDGRRGSVRVGADDVRAPDLRARRPLRVAVSLTGEPPRLRVRRRVVGDPRER